MIALPHFERKKNLNLRARHSNWHVPWWASGQLRPFITHTLRLPDFRYPSQAFRVSFAFSGLGLRSKSQ
jgi:hypothetical protein